MSAIAAIMDEIDVRLKRMSVVNGDAVTIRSVTRAKLSTIVAADLPALNYWWSNDAIEARGHGYEDHALSVAIEAYDVTRERPFVDVAEELGSSLKTVLFRDTSNIESPALGGLVQSLHVDNISALIGEGSANWCGAMIELTIRYRTALGKTELL